MGDGTHVPAASHNDAGWNCVATHNEALHTVPLGLGVNPQPLMLLQVAFIHVVVLLLQSCEGEVLLQLPA